MNIHLEYSLTVDDYHERRRACQPKWRWLKYSIIMWAGVLGIAITISAILHEDPRVHGTPEATRDYYSGLLTFFALGLGIVAFWIYSCYLMRSKSVSRRKFRLNPKLGRPLLVDLTDAQMAVRMEGSTVATDWPQLKRFQETATLFLIFFTAEYSLILPKRAFPSPEAINEFRNFVPAHIGNQPIGFPVQPPSTQSVPPLVPAVDRSDQKVT